jgi:UDP-glucose 4-epimerase
VSVPAALGGRTVLVTGASGFVGSALRRRLAASMDVHVVSRQAQPTSDGEHWWVVDLAQLDQVRALLQRVRPDVIFHLATHAAAARDLGLVLPTFTSSLVSTVNLATVATELGCRRFVLTSSMEEPVTAGAVPSSPYAAAKQGATAYTRMFHALFGLPAVVLRLFMVYGPGEHLHKLVPYVILSLLRGEAPKLMSGRREIDWVYVEDVVDALLAAAVTADIEGQTLDVGSARLVAVRQMVETIVRLLESPLEPQFGAVADRAFEQIRIADITGTAARLGWTPSTSLEEGLRRTIAWCADRLETSRASP